VLRGGPLGEWLLRCVFCSILVHNRLDSQWWRIVVADQMRGGGLRCCLGTCALGILGTHFVGWLGCRRWGWMRGVLFVPWVLGTLRLVVRCFVSVFAFVGGWVAVCVRFLVARFVLVVAVGVFMVTGLLICLWPTLEGVVGGECWEQVGYVHSILVWGWLGQFCGSRL